MTGQDILLAHESLDTVAAPGVKLLDRIRGLVADHQRLLDQLEARNKLTDRDRLLASLDEDRNETLMALHDACLDAGLEDEASAWGWLAMSRKWPIWGGKSWMWLVDMTVNPEKSSCHIPRDVFSTIITSKPAVVSPAPVKDLVFPTPRAALEAVVEAIVEIRMGERNL